MSRNLFSNTPNAAMPMTASPVQHGHVYHGAPGSFSPQDHQWYQYHHHPPPPHSQHHIQPQTGAYLNSPMGVSGYRDAGRMPQTSPHNSLTTARRDLDPQTAGNGTHAPGATPRIPPNNLASMHQPLPNMQQPIVEQDTTNESMSRETSPATDMGTPRDADVHSRDGTLAAKRNARSIKRDFAAMRARDLQPMERKARSMLQKRVRDKYRKLAGVEKRADWHYYLSLRKVGGDIPDFDLDITSRTNKDFINDVAHEVCEEIKDDTKTMRFLTKHQIHWDENTVVKITKEVHRGFKVEYKAQKWLSAEQMKKKKSQKENRVRQRRKTKAERRRRGAATIENRWDFNPTALVSDEWMSDEHSDGEDPKEPKHQFLRRMAKEKGHADADEMSWTLLKTLGPYRERAKATWRANWVTELFYAMDRYADDLELRQRAHKRPRATIIDNWRTCTEPPKRAPYDCMIDREWFEKEAHTFPEHTREYFHQGNPKELRRISQYTRNRFGITDDELEQYESDDESGQDES